MKQPSKDKSKILYDAVSKDYNLGTYDEFKSKLMDDEKRKVFFESVGKEYNLGSYSEFETKLSDLLKKKNESQSASQDQELASVQKVENGSLAISQDERGQLVKDIDSGKLDERSKQLQKENEKTGKSTYEEELGRSLKKGLSRLGKSIAATPELIYDFFAIPQNTVADLTDTESLSTNSEKFKQTIGIENTVKDGFSKDLKELQLVSQKLDDKYIGDITDNFKKGNYSDGFKMLGSSIVESLPASLAVAVSGGVASPTQILTGVTTVFGADASEEYKEQNPEMNDNERMVKSLGKGFAEGIFSTIGTSRIGAAAKQIITNEGKEQGGKILKAQLVDMYTELLKKAPIPVAMLGEGLEEAATTITQNAIDEKPVMQGVSDAFLVGMGSGGSFGVALEGLKQISKDKISPTDIENVEITKEKEQSIKNELSQQVIDGDLKPKEAKDIYDNWEEIKSNLQAVPEEFTPEQKAKAVEILKEKKKLEKEIEGKEPALVESKKAKIEELNNQLKEIGNAKSEETATENQEPKVENTTPETEAVEKGVESFKIENRDTFYHASSKKRVGRLTPNNAPQFGTGVYFSTNKDKVEYEFGNASTTEVKLDLQNPVYTNTKEWNDIEKRAIELADIDYGKKKGLTLDTENDETYFRYDKENLSEVAEIPSEFISDAAKELGYDAIIDKGSSQYENEIVVLDESKIIYPEDNETAPSENTSPNGNLSTGIEPSVQQGESDNIQPAIDTGTDTGKTEIRTYKTTDSDKATEYQVAFENGSLNIKDKDGNEPSPQTKRKILDKYSDDVDFTQGETATVTPDITNPNDFVAQNSKNPAELAILLNDTNTQSFIENNIDYKTRVIADHLTNIEKTSYENFGDRNKIGNNMARSYFSKKGEGRSLDTLAEELSEDYGIEITEQDLVEHMENYPGGKNDVYKEFRDNNIKPLQDKFTELTGLPANDKYISKAVEQAIKKEQLNKKIENDYLNILPDKELVSLSQEVLEYEKFRQQNPETDSSDAGGIETKDTSGSKSQSRVREGIAKTNGEQASQSRVKALTNERVKPLKRKPKAKPKKINEIIANVSDKLKATLIYGKSGRRNSAGTYNSTNALVKIRNAGDIDTVAHELGHLLDDRFGILEKINQENPLLRKDLSEGLNRFKEPVIKKGEAETITKYLTKKYGIESVLVDMGMFKSYGEYNRLTNKININTSTTFNKKGELTAAINPTGYMPRRTIFHEYLHPFVEILEKENKDLYDEIHRQALEENLNNQFTTVSHYPKNQQKEELVVRYLDRLSDSDKPPSLLQQFLDWISQLFHKNASNKKVSLKKLSTKTTVEELYEVFKNYGNLNEDIQKVVRKDTQNSRIEFIKSILSNNEIPDSVKENFRKELNSLTNFENKIQGQDNLLILNQLKWFSDRGGSNPPTGLSKAKKAEYLEREGLGEFIRAYIANPKQAKVIAPELYSLFESSIDAETKAILKEFSNDYLDFANATYTEKTLSNIEDSTLPDKKGFKDWLEKNFSTKEGKLNITFMDKLKSNWTNSMHLPNKAFKFIQGVKGVDVNKLLPEESFEVMSRLFAGINGKFNYVFSKGMIDAKGNLLKDSQGKNMNVKYLIEALDGTTEQSLREEMSDVIAYMIAQRTVEYAKKLGRIDNLTGIGAGIDTDLDVAIGTLEEYKQLKKDNPEKHERIIEGARRYREFADAGLKYALEKGRINQEQYDRIKETNEYYVSLARTKEVTPGEEMLPFLKESNKITSVKEPIKKIKGGADVIKNPYLSLLQNTVNFIKESDRNEVMESFIEPLRSTRAMGDGTPIDLSQVGRKVPSGEKNTIKLYNNGVLEHWQFDQDIYDGLKGLESIAHNPIISALGKPADLIRFTVTNFPVFALRNAFRDTMSRLIISRTKGSVADLWHNKEDRSVFELYGGSQAGFYMTNQEGYKETMNQAVKDLTKKGGIVLDPRKLTYTNYRKLLERGENLNRVAEYKSAYRKAKKEGMDDYNAGLYAAYQARDLMDFAVAGHSMRVINKLVPFSNASVQSVKRSVKGAKENPGKFAMRMALYTVLPQIAFRAFVAANGDDEEYEQLPDYQRDLFWNFKTPLTGDKWISLPKPFELGLPSSLLDRAYSKSKGEENAFNGAAWSSFKTLFPFDEASLLGGAKPIIETAVNYDMFRDREIVPFWEKDKLLELRDGTKYASRIGSALSDGFGVLGTEVDPRKIDHIIKGYTTYYGDWALSLGDIGKEDSRNQFNATKTGFMRDVPISNAKSVKKAYDLAKSIGADSDKNVKVLKGMVKTYYDLEDKEAKKKLSKAIYQYSQEVLIPYLEAKKQIELVTKDIN